MKLGKQKFPNLEQRRLADGRIGWYWNPPPAARGAFKSSALGPELDADALERYALLQRALEKWREEQKRRNDPIAGPLPGTVDWIIAEYQKTTRFTDLREKTQIDYRNKLRALANFRLRDGERFGDKPWTKVQARHADRLYQWLRIGPSGDRHPYARSLMILAKVVWNYAKRYHRKQFEENPFEAMKLKTPPARSVKWTAVQVWALCEKAEEMGRLSVAIAAVICYELGQRPGDARALCRAAFEGNRIRVVQGKTRKELLLPVSDVLTSYLKKLPPEQEQLVVNETTGGPYEDYELSKAVAEVREAAQLPSFLQIRDLRRTCLSELGDLGATDDELISVSGHATRQMLDVYSVRADTRALKAMARRWANRHEAEPREQESTVP